MKEDDDYQMMLEENFLKHIGYEHVNNINEQMDRNLENEDITYPVALDEWFENFYQKDKRLNSKKYNQNQQYNKNIYIKRVAVILMFLVGINVFLITNVEAFRLSIFDTFVKVTSKFTQVEFIRDNGIEGDEIDIDEFSVDWTGDYYPTMVPTGYDILSMNVQDGVQTIIFTNEENKTISFYQSSLQLGQMSNTENGTVEKVMIGDHEALYMNNDDVSIMNIQLPGGYYIVLEADALTKEEMIMIMDNIEHK